MPVREIYLDNSATTKPAPEVVRAVVDCMENIYGNPSSVHKKGVDAERMVNRARESLAGVMGVRPGEVIFTSGGTESNNLAIKGAAISFAHRGKHIITTEIEHPAVLNVCRDLEDEGFEVTYLPVDSEGVINPGDLKDAICRDTILVSTMYVNNEIGSIQPVEEIGRHIKGARGNGRLPLWHVDAVQALGKLPLNPAGTGMDLVSVSAHKMHGPKGTGALYVSGGTRLHHIMAGGGQEKNLRSGTENVPGIAGFGAAVNNLPDRREAVEHMAGLRRVLVEKVLEEVEDCRLNGPPPGSNRAAPHIVNISFRGIRGEVLVHWLEGEDIYASTGSACSSRKAGEHGVLNSIGLNEREKEGALRFSFHPENTGEEIEVVVEKLKEGVKELRSLG